MQVEKGDGRVCPKSREGGEEGKGSQWQGGRGELNTQEQGQGRVAGSAGRALSGASTPVSCVNNRKPERSLLHPLELS